MSQSGYTPISLYYSSTASAVPTAGNLVAGELALNNLDGKLFYKDNAGVVQVIGTKGGVGSSTTTQVLYNSSGLVVGSAGLTFDGTNFATTGTATATRFIPSGSTIATNGLYLPATNSLGFSTNSTEAMRIDSSGRVLVGLTSANTSGANLQVSQGVTFPATQSASSDANTLDDYEEGTWTPTQGSGLIVVGSFSSSGKYTKIGRMVYASGFVAGSTSVAFSAGSIIASSLPFSATTSPQQSGTGINANTNAGSFILAYNTDVFGVNSMSATSYFFFNIAYQAA